MTLPGKVSLARLPTPIHPLPRLSRRLGVDVFLKRDDMTGAETGGNKIRKLEFVLHDALQEGASVLITCGGLQSNHARATAAAARRLGLDCHLVLRGHPQGPGQGNLLLNRVLGASMTFLDPEAFAAGHEEVMEGLASAYASRGRKAFVIPMGASTPTGTFGYAAAYEEVLAQEAERNEPFDLLACAVGSGGTLAGLALGNLLHGRRHRILGIPVCDSGAVFAPIVQDLVDACLQRLSRPETLTRDDPEFADGYVGRGYALSTPEELAFIRSIAEEEGVVLDPVYTGKAFRGLLEEFRRGALTGIRRILFLHTGGLFGLFPKADEIGFEPSRSGSEETP